MFTAAITTSAVKKHLISLLSNNLLCVKICSIIKYYDKRTIKTSSRTYDVHARNTCTVFCMSTWEELPGLPTERGEKIAYKSKVVLRNVLLSPITLELSTNIIENFH